MRYRMEVMDGEPAIRNVETDVVVGAVPGSGYDAKDPDLKANFDVAIWNGQEISGFPRQPLESALSAIAFNEADNGYPSLKNCAAKPNPVRIEFALGELIADAASTLARGVIEDRSGALQKETGEKFADLTVQIFRIRWASAFGSFNGETRQKEPYFLNVWTNERVTFDTAAQCYGMFELTMRFPDVSEEEPLLQELLSSAIEFVKQATEREMPTRLPTEHMLKPYRSLQIPRENPRRFFVL